MSSVLSQFTSSSEYFPSLTHSIHTCFDFFNGCSYNVRFLVVWNFYNTNMYNAMQHNDQVETEEKSREAKRRGKKRKEKKKQNMPNCLENIKNSEKPSWAFKYHLSKQCSCCLLIHHVEAYFCFKSGRAKHLKLSFTCKILDVNCKN